LPAQAAADGQTILLAEARLPEPCLWTPDLPHRYDVQVQAARGEHPLNSHRQWLGIRSIGVREKNLVMSGKRWVLRGTFCSGDLRPWLSGLAAVRLCGIVEPPDEDALEQASRDGVMLVVKLESSGSIESVMRRIARHAAAACALVSGRFSPGTPACETHRLGYENLLLAQRFQAGETVVPAPWADLAWVEDTRASRLAERSSDCAIPVVACSASTSGSSSPASFSDARRLCENWQRDLAPWGDFAGYVV
jgi:hypothetical protein